MHDPSTPKGGETLARAERLVILQLAGIPRGRPREQLLRSLRRERVEQAIASLAAVGIVVSTGHRVRQSSALERFEALGFIEV